MNSSFEHNFNCSVHEMTNHTAGFAAAQSWLCRGADIPVAPIADALITITRTRYRPGRGETICPRQWQFDPKIAANLRPSADGSAVRTSLVAGGGKAAGSQRAYSLGSCAMGQTDGRIALFQNAPPPTAGHNKLLVRIIWEPSSGDEIGDQCGLVESEL